MTSLPDVPDEVLVQILEQAADGQSPLSILQFALVGKAFARIAVPLMYRHIVLEYGFRCEPLLLDSPIKALLQDTAKIVYVQSLIPEAKMDCSGPRRSKPGAISLEALVKLKRDQISGMIDETFDGEGMQKRVRWRRKCLDERSPIHLFALLFPRMSRLHTFDIAELSQESWHILAESVKCHTRYTKSAGQTLPLQALETVGLGHRYQALHNNSTPLNIVLGWPAVKRVTARRIVDPIDSTKKSVEVPFPTTKSISPSLNTVRLVRSQVPAEYLTKLLGSIRALETFEYEFGQFYVGPLTLEVSELSTALSQQFANLRTIKLELFDPDYRVLGETSPPMDFQYFENLRKLVIGCGLLLGKGSGIELTRDTAEGHILKALPLSLEEFSVTKCTTATEADIVVVCLKAMIQNKEEKFPGLEKIHWRCRFYYGGGTVLRAESPWLSEYAKLKAIKFTTFNEQERPDEEAAKGGMLNHLKMFADGVRPWDELALWDKRRWEGIQYQRARYEEQEAILRAEL